MKPLPQVKKEYVKNARKFKRCNMKRFTILLIALVMIIQTFLIDGCEKEIEVSETTTANITEVITEPDIQDTSLLIFDKMAINFAIIRSTYADNVTVGAAVTLNHAFRDAYPGNWKATISDDFVLGQKRDDVFEIEGKEILVGLTNRKESHDVHSSLNKDQFTIKAVGEKLVIVGYDSYATSAAVDYFVETFLSEKIEDSFVIESNYEYCGEASLRKIAISDEAQYRIMTWNLGCMVSEEKNGQLECIDILLRYLPDIIGLQECNSAVHSKVLKNLPANYAFANKTHANSSTVNYTPIMYNKDLFTVLKSGLVWLRGRYTGTNTKSLNWAVFEDKNGVKFALINYHGAVCSNSYKGFENYTSSQLSDQATEWKLDNVVQVIEIKNAIIAEFGNIPIMVSGDNNFNSSSQPYKNLAADGFVDAELTARISKVTGYKTSYSYGSVPGTGLSIDHIFGLNNVDFVVHFIVRGDDVWKASDHCPVYVDFNITK
jgi:endonuclease/exonuclease/phosphatase family metal-dependent hydrolase